MGHAFEIVRALAPLACAAAIPAGVGAAAGAAIGEPWIALIFGSVLVIASATIAGYVASCRVKDRAGQPWAYLTILAIVAGGGWAGLVAMWCTMGQFK